MFTGLIEETGKIVSITPFDGGLEFVITGKLVMSDLDIDHSISINGACQTVVDLDKKSFKVQSIKETLEKTTFGFFKVGDEVNLERAMRSDTRLGGHFVQGHVNGTGTLVKIEQRGENYLIGLNIGPDLHKYCVKEGSITIDGISLTIADINETELFISIIPHTWNVTNLSDRKIGDKLNIEIDMFAKYIFTYLERFQK